ncbi:protein O-mannosyl-transferase 2 [Tribolium castaneum]|uniref:protein O-mannosyl-transferase 2 n=1 Tax=Tribolium castaneum TaxID=7070 RepID=UPI0000D5691F|nr:PREDICTED: protein O-mannosyl-transferase 2 [Tribolium castaneum]|eukprot:XP_973439.1 PREDICTED: protein O-mannosyl-transferase 2 [Tribolium castaneum]
MVQKEKNLQKSFWWLIFGTICVLTMTTRFYKIAEPDHVCWDETHFGKMGSWYINRTFFFDVHPPLGKMLIGLSGYLTGYDGTFAFDKPGDKYENTSYVGMRVFCTALGATLVPMSFLAVDEMTQSITAATFASLLILFDVGILTLTQYILLDPILLCFIMGSVLGAVKVSSPRIKEFTATWWFWLVFTGTMLACCISVKFVGLFVVLLVGLMTIADLWSILGDMSRPVMDTVKHLVSRGICLIVWPILLYITFFYIHLSVLNRSGNGDGFYSSAFQSQLIGNSLHNASMPRQVAYGAIITLKNHRTGGGYLHSHYHLYPENVGARQQQITTYTHKDDNNKWLVKKYNTEDTSGVTIVRSGDLVRLEHVPTRRNLHSHKEQAPITKKHYQVTGYGENGTGDANDVWKITVIGAKDGSEVTAVSSKLKFVHYLQSCILTTSGKQLPKWAYEQQEVSCNPNLRDPHGVWNVEENIFEKLPNVSFEVYAPSFLERFFESHAVMFQGNAGLKPKEGEITSRPWQWPINYRGQFFSGSSYRVYLLGNPVIWWANIIFLLVFVFVFGANAIRQQRGYIKSFSESHKEKLVACAWLFLGWLLHYVPFWAMGRVLYFHHYFPALLFSSMITGIIIDYLLEEIPKFFTEKTGNVVYHTLVALVLSTVVYSFYLFAPLTYGMSGPNANEPNSTMYGLKWLDTWEF